VHCSARIQDFAELVGSGEPDLARFEKLSLLSAVASEEENLFCTKGSLFLTAERSALRYGQIDEPGLKS
jgi:hypothetical protein